MARPFGGERLGEELDRIRAEGVDVVVSLLEPLEEVVLELRGEGAACAAAGVELLRFPVRDHDVPQSPDAVIEIGRQISARLDAKKAVAIHCYAGIGRSSLLAAAVLILRGMRAEDAFAKISHARGVLVPDTIEQRNWIATFELKQRSDNPRREP